MFELFVLFVFFWLLFKAVGLGLKLTWGAAKIIATILIALAVPLVFVCLLFVGGIALLVPVVIVAAAIGILKACT